MKFFKKDRGEDYAKELQGFIQVNSTEWEASIKVFVELFNRCGKQYQKGELMQELFLGAFLYEIVKSSNVPKEAKKKVLALVFRESGLT